MIYSHFSVKKENDILTHNMSLYLVYMPKILSEK
jgi:hypothetical protein